MKRSEVNQIIHNALAFCAEMNFKLPPFAYWSPREWESKGPEYDEIRDTMLGWDITDFGTNTFDRIGLVMLTLRNGSNTNPKYAKRYAEKLLIVQEEQITPFHFHWQKTEDIINRGGGNLAVQLYNATQDGQFDDSPVTVSIDGRRHLIDAGGIVRLLPGESITLPSGLYHKFWGETGYGNILLGEVSMVNDDRVDNRFYEPAGRFPDIEEDEAPVYLLCTEYPNS